MNGKYYTRALVDTGCLSYGTVSQAFAERSRMMRIEIHPRSLQETKSTVKGAITEVAYGDIDLDGFKQSQVYFYVIPGQYEDVILGLGWMKDQRAVPDPSTMELRIGDEGFAVQIRGESEAPGTMDLHGQTAQVFTALVRRARKEGHQAARERGRAQSSPNELRVFTASMEDIEKALAPKPKVNLHTAIPPQYREFIGLFDKKEADRLPPSPWNRPYDRAGKGR